MQAEGTGASLCLKREQIRLSQTNPLTSVLKTTSPIEQVIQPLGVDVEIVSSVTPFVTLSEHFEELFPCRHFLIPEARLQP
jgi:hypothetical protein